MSKRPLAKFLSFLVLSLSAAFYGCETAQEPTSETGPQWAVGYNYTPLRTANPISETTVKAVFGRNGGVMRVAGHTLVVTERAVNEDTEFTFRVVGGNTVWVDLTARRVRDGASVTKFQRNLLLQLSYKDAAPGFDPQRLFVGYLEQGKRHGLPAARIQKMTGQANVPEQTVSALLNHFSEYEILVD